MPKTTPSTPAKNAQRALLPSVKLALSYHSQAETSFRLGAVYAALCGLELKHLKSEVAHGDWEAFIVAQFGEGLPLRTAQKYMQVAEGLKLKAKVGTEGVITFNPPKQAEQGGEDVARSYNLRIWKWLKAAPGKLTLSQRMELAKAVASIADGETMASLIEAYRISKRPKGSGVEGGYRPDPAKLAEFLGAYHADLVGTPYEKLSADVQAHFRKWAAQRLEDPSQMAFDFCRPVLDAFEHPDFAGFLRQLPPEEKQRMLDHAEALVRQLREDVRENARQAA